MVLPYLEGTDQGIVMAQGSLPNELEPEEGLGVSPHALETHWRL
jgi:hypothetical protein